jgi:multiple sugar transport system substrate-binding protein
MPAALNRRQFLTYAGAAALGASTLPRHAWAQAVPRVAPITMVINQSPWFGGFRQLVEQYTKETGNKIELDVNPCGALDKIRNCAAMGPKCWRRQQLMVEF